MPDTDTQGVALEQRLRKLSCLRYAPMHRASEEWQAADLIADLREQVGQLERDNETYRTAFDGIEPTAQSEDKWAIDRSTDSPILTYEKCSVIQDEQAFYVLGLIRAAQEGREAVAWQYRQKSNGGMWSMWCIVPEDTATSYASENRTDIQVRPLYTTPAQPAAQEGREAVAWRRCLTEDGDWFDVTIDPDRAEMWRTSYADTTTVQPLYPHPAPAQPAAQVVEALVLMVDAFLSRNGGSFPMDEVTEEQRLWKHAMKAAYAVVGQPRTRERGEKLAALRADAAVAVLREARDWISDNIREGDIAGCTLLGKLSALTSPTDANTSTEVDYQRIENALASCASLIRALSSDEVAKVAAQELDYAYAALTAAKAGEDGR